MMKLYSSVTSPFVRKVLVVGHELGLADQLEVVPVVLSPTAPDAGLSGRNPLGKIPTLELEDGTMLFDSRVIVTHLLTLSDKAEQVLPRGKKGLLTLRAEAAADGLLDAGILSRYETVLRPEQYRWSAWVDGQCDKVERALRWLEENIDTSGSSFDLARIATACALGWLQFRKPLSDRSQGEKRMEVIAPKLFDWFESVRSRPSLQATEPH